jgi:hypothetical protein
MRGDARRIIPNITPNLFERPDVEGTWRVSETCATFGGTLSPESANANIVRLALGYYLRTTDLDAYGTLWDTACHRGPPRAL